MKHASVQVSIFLFTLAPLFAQTQIGGGACNSSTLTGPYAFTLTGRQVSAAGAFSSALHGNGTATFDGQNKVTLAFTANSLQGLGAPLTYSGTYSVQANCAGVINLTSGDTATLNLAIFNEGKNFILTGSDATYEYTGNGNDQPTGCSASTLNGAFAFNATGYSYSGTSVNGVADTTGLMQFDGMGNVTLNFTASSAASGTAGSVTGSGTYTLASGCTGTVNFTDSNGKSGTAAISMTTVSTNGSNGLDFDLQIADASKLIVSGTAHSIQSTASNASGNCSASSLNGAYAFTLSGRAVSSAGAFTGTFQSNGTATFDGQGKVTMSLTANTNQALAKALTYSGTYTIASSCSGSISLTSGSTANFNLVVWSSGNAFNIAGQDATYVYSGSGVTPPKVCATSTVSGAYAFSANGFALAGSNVAGVLDTSGILQFDGQGNFTASYVSSTVGGSLPITATGTYSVNTACIGSGTFTDSTGKSLTLNFAVNNPTGADFDLIAAYPQQMASGTAHNTILNPSQSIGNVASYAVNYTPAGSVFVLFGQNLATGNAQATKVPLSNTLLTTTVTVNGEQAPLFFVSTGQIDAQMPWDIPGGTVATVVVKNGSSTSNAAAVFVPATGAPGINAAGAIANQDGSVNSSSNPAKVGDEMTAFFTGGGPVQASGSLTTGAGSPPGLSSVTGNYTVTVGNQTANVVYVGLSPGSVGLYQANFFVPQLAKGTYPVVITIGGQPSNTGTVIAKPTITVSN